MAAPTLVLLLGASTGSTVGHSRSDAQPEMEAPLSAEQEARLREAARLRASALAAMEDGNFGRAANELEQLAKLLPDNILPPINQAICYFRLNRTDAALEQIRRARRMDPENPQMLYTFARLLESNPAFDETLNEILNVFASRHPGDPRPDYLRALAAVENGRHGDAVVAYNLAQARALDNLVLMVERLVAAAEAADIEATSDALDAIEDRLNGFDGSVETIAEELRDLIDERQVAALRPRAQVLRNLLRPSELYQLGLIPLTGGRGSSGALFPQLDFDPPLPKSIQGGKDLEITFVDVPIESALPDDQTADFVGHYRGNDQDRMAGVHAGGLVLYDFEAGQPADRAVALEPVPEGPFVSYDIDQDGISDLAAVVRDKGLVLYTGTDDGSYSRGVVIDPSIVAEAAVALNPLDLDHDGDLDLFVTLRQARDRYLQNNGDGTWTERAEELGLAGDTETTTGIAVADFDEDGDLDLVTSHSSATPRLYLNSMADSFDEASAEYGLPDADRNATGISTADFDSNGRFDLLLWGPRGLHLLFNRTTGFESQDLANGIEDGWSAVTIGDFDNDGDQDIMGVTAASGRLRLIRNRNSGFEVETFDLEAGPTRRLFAGDFDDDGDLDLAALHTDGSQHRWRNDGGNRNQWLRLTLRGLYDNNSKNNTQGLFVRIETRLGDTVYTVLGNGGGNLIGLGSARQADVVRVVWTNGLAQTWLQVAANQTLVEKQVLKGSCPMLFTWNGERFQFHTDLMWRSTLGMQLADGSTGSHLSARDYVLIPGDQLQPTGGELWLQVTEELWETIYLDQAELIAIDHPAEIDLVVDERLTNPPYPQQPPAHWIGNRLRPIAATDQQGRNVLDRISHRDENYVDDLPLSRFQGLTDGHELQLSFADIPSGQRLRLVLWGWIFPTDSSINFALSQGAEAKLRPPSLEIHDPDGSWRTLLPFLGLPNGKRKSLVLELTDQLPSGEVTLRIATSMQIYWDAAILAVGDPRPAADFDHLEVSAADLHYRGFSRRYRESSSGPHLFAYEKVAIDHRFRDMRGQFTRHGDVRSLVLDRDDQYAIMSAGDELTLRFVAHDLSKPPPGWRRDYILFTDGWVKDADLHTAFSQTVAPLPHHGMSSYSLEATAGYMRSQEQLDIAERYQTRRVSDESFRGALRHPQAVLIWGQGLDLSPHE